MAPVARIGPPALNPLFDLSGLKPILCRDWGPLDYPEVGAPKLVFMLDPIMLICKGPPEGAAVFLAIAGPKLPTVEMPPRFEDLPSFKLMDFELLPLVEVCPECAPLGY